MASQLNPLMTTPGITLSGGNLTATGGAGSTWLSSFGTPLFNSGKWYWEATVAHQSSANAPLIGVGLRAPYSVSSATSFVGGNTYGVGWTQSGNVYYNDATIATGYPTFTTGSVLSFAVDYANKAIWVRVGGGNWNGSGTANPATNTGGLSIASLLTNPVTLTPGLSLFYASDSITYNFGDTAFSFAVPSGFTAVTSASTAESIFSAAYNGEVASHSATFTTYGAAKGVTPPATHGVSSLGAQRSSVVTQAWYGGMRQWSPAAAATNVSGTVEEFTVGVTGKTVMVFDPKGVFIGSTTSGVAGAWGPIPCLGRSQVFAVAFDPTSFQMIGYDRVTPV